ncbi:hypothetical protein EVA_01752 [gut metagenome]|uniref:Uncharacterized protein n=1 Tax=gut metagenome TaxID=749906 RepID=J9GPJ9_9ZZZZ
MIHLHFTFSLSVACHKPCMTPAEHCAHRCLYTIYIVRTHLTNVNKHLNNTINYCAKEYKL